MRTLSKLSLILLLPLLIAVLPGCILGVLETEDRFIQQYVGTVHAPDGAPVVGARVELWLTDDSLTSYPPVHRVSTETSGDWFIENVHRGKGPFPFLQVLITPPAATGLGPKRVIGTLGDFPAEPPSPRREGVTRRRIDVTLEPAP